MGKDIGLKIKFAIIGLVLGVIVTAVFGFSMAGWVTASTADTMT